MQLLFPNAALSESVRETLLARVLHDDKTDIIRQTATLQRAVKTLLTLSQQQQALNRQLKALENKYSHFRQQRSMLIERQRQNRRRIAALKKQLEEKNFSEPQLQLRRTLTRLKNTQARQQKQLAFIDNTLNKLLPIQQDIQTRGQRLESQAREPLSRSRTALTDALARAQKAYYTALRDSAGEAQLQIAELMHPHR